MISKKVTRKTSKKNRTKSTDQVAKPTPLSQVSKFSGSKVMSGKRIQAAKHQGLVGRVYVFLKGTPAAEKAEILHRELQPWILSQFQPQKEVQFFSGLRSPVWFLQEPMAPASVSHEGLLEVSPWAFFRESAGQVVQQALGNSVTELQWHLPDRLSSEAASAVVVGCELAKYRFQGSAKLVNQFESFPDDAKKRGLALSEAVNWARHISNLGPNMLYPEKMAEEVKKWITQVKKRSSGTLEVEVWDEKKLAKERMNLMLAVGQGSKNPPRLIILRYTPSGRGMDKKPPVVLVGKGITFDTGGVDIKPSSAMRLMKKDMAGSATVAAVFGWAGLAQLNRPVVAYLAMAENSVDGGSFRPSDILESRAGLKVEIHNTDAEGRLVLADAMDVAIEQNPKLSALIDVATLTGAIKTALGSEIAGLFSNDDELSRQIQWAGQENGELCWRMPMYSKYFSALSSPFADFVNASDGFGGAITAALFLEKFTHQKPWAHLDIYGWTDRATGSLSFAGANGQAVQLLAKYLESSD